MILEGPARKNSDCLPLITEGACRFERFDFGNFSISKSPVEVESLSDRNLKLRAEEAWRTACRLELAIRLIMNVLYANSYGISISTFNQMEISKSFPEDIYVRGIQAALDHLATLRQGDRPASNPYETSFSDKETFDSLFYLPSLMGREARALYAIGIHSPRFASTPEPKWTSIASVLHNDSVRGFTNITVKPPVFILRDTCDPDLNRLWEEIRRFKELLSRSPTTALRVSMFCTDTPPAARMSVNFEALTITLDGTSYGASEEGVALIRALLHAKGTFRTEKELWKDEPLLNGKRIRRDVVEKLHEKIMPLVKGKTGAGFRLTEEVW